MKRRQLLILAGIALALGGCFANNYLASLKQSSKRQPPPPSVRSAGYVEVQNEELKAEIPITGKLVAKDKIEIYAEVTGNLLTTSSRFKEGNVFSTGDLLIGIDSRELNLNIQSQRSNFLSLLTRVLPDLKLDYPEAFDEWKTYVDGFSVSKPLNDLPKVGGKEKYYLSTQGVFNQFYTIKSQEARLAKYAIRAPFTGTVSEANINPGTLVRAGQKLGEFIKTGIFEMEAPIDLDYLKFVKVGSEVVLESPQVAGAFIGKISRISEALDPATQSAKVIVEVSDKKVIEGMYLTGSILTTPFPDVFRLRKNQINEQNETYLIVDGKLKATKVDIAFTGENEVLVTNLKNGDKVLEMIYSGVFDGAPINVGTNGESENNNTEAANL